MLMKDLDIAGQTSWRLKWNVNLEKSKSTLFVHSGPTHIVLCFSLSCVPYVASFSWFSFLVHLAKGHVSFCHHLSSVIVHPSYVVNFNLLLRNHWANCSQTLVEWYLYGPLPKLCLLIPTSNQDSRQAKNRKKGGWNFNCWLQL